MAFNKAILLGRITADPELKKTTSGISVVSFTLAVDRKYQKEGEEKKADFIVCNAYRQTAEFVCRNFRKGNTMLVSGEIQQRQWQDNNGNARYATEIAVDEVSFTGGKTTQPNEQFASEAVKSGSPAVQQTIPQTAPKETPKFEALTPDEDLPF